MQTLTEIKSLLSSRGIRPKHRFGQNFLHDHNQLRKLTESAALTVSDTVLEIGPGTGTLTESLMETGARVVVCDIDPDMLAIVTEHVAPRFESDRLHIVEGDCLASKRSINPELFSHVAGRFKLVANLPYQITSPLIATLLTQHWSESAPCCCDGIFITVQREAADRILSDCGTKDYGPLAILASILCDRKRIAQLPPSCFWPAPKINSSMIALRPKKLALQLDTVKMASVLAQGFQNRRKQIRSAFRGMQDWPIGIEPTMRPEQITPEQWITLFHCVMNAADG